MVYAVLRQGNHQYRVQPGDVIQIEKIDAEKGTEVELEDVLLVNDGSSVEYGTPRVEGASVKARVVRNGRGRKIVVFKFKRRKGYHKKQGHRQSFTEVRITDILKGGQVIAGVPAAASAPAPVAEESAEAE